MKDCVKERSKRQNEWRVWSGSEEHRRFGASLGHLYGVGSRAQIATFSLLQGRKLPTTSTVISACGGKKGRERVRESPARPRERRPLVGLSPSGAWESGVRSGAFCAEERRLSTRGGPFGPRTAGSDLRGLTLSSSLNAHICADALTQT